MTCEVSPQDTLAALRQTLEDLDKTFERVQDDKRKAAEELRVRIVAWDADMLRMREVRAKIVEEIKLSSQRVRGIR